MAYLSGNEEEMNDILKCIDSSVLYLNNTHISVDKIINILIIRYYCLSPKQYKRHIEKYNHHKEVLT